LCSDIDPAHPGSECYSADTDPQKDFAFALMHNSRGQVISEENLCGFGPRAVYWDADPQRELLNGGKLWKYKGATLAKIEGDVIAVADVLGDWREEIITSRRGELRIYTTPIPATDRRVCLMQDPLYRMDVVVAAMGYYQVPMLSYDLARGKK
jgi:rhamnogalacturonan endolyase